MITSSLTTIWLITVCNHKKGIADIHWWFICLQIIQPRPSTNFVVLIKWTGQLNTLKLLSITPTVADNSMIVTCYCTTVLVKRTSYSATFQWDNCFNIAGMSKWVSSCCLETIINQTPLRTCTTSRHCGVVCFTRQHHNACKPFIQRVVLVYIDLLTYWTPWKSPGNASWIDTEMLKGSHSYMVSCWTAKCSTCG